MRSSPSGVTSSSGKARLPSLPRQWLRLQQLQWNAEHSGGPHQLLAIRSLQRPIGGEPETPAPGEKALPERILHHEEPRSLQRQIERIARLLEWTWREIRVTAHGRISAFGIAGDIAQVLLNADECALEE
jgi:hypothetical protein